MAKVPWDYSEAPEPGAPSVVNLPTPAGRILGRRLARLCDEAEADQLQRFPNQKPRCHDCAFRGGTRPNGCPETLMDAIKCAVEARPFMCHVGMKDDDDDPKRICAGWMIMVSTTATGKLGMAKEAVAASVARQEGCMPILLGPRQPTRGG